MANFSAIFAGCESFMEGDVEINNDVSVPAGDGEAVASEVEAETTAAEGGEAVGEAEADSVKDEAANMVFNQILNMYDHVKANGIDRTFLSLYNGSGQLDNMIGYKFPSCESMDVVGSPNSSVSRAFIAAMEEDNIFKKIWDWIKSVCKRIWDFVVKIVNWLRSVFGNLDIKIGRLSKYFTSHTVKEWNDISGVEIKYTTEDDCLKAQKLCNSATNQAGTIKRAWRFINPSVSVNANTSSAADGIGGIVNVYASFAQATITDIQDITKTAKKEMGLGRKDEVTEEAATKWNTQFTKEYIDPISAEINKMHTASGVINKLKWGTPFSGGYRGGFGSSKDIENCVRTNLEVIKKALTANLNMKKGLDILNDTYKRALAFANQQSQHDNDKTTVSAMKDLTSVLSSMTSTVGKVANLQYKMCGKAIADLSSLTTCYK